MKMWGGDRGRDKKQTNRGSCNSRSDHALTKCLANTTPRSALELAIPVQLVRYHRRHVLYPYHWNGNKTRDPFWAELGSELGELANVEARGEGDVLVGVDGDFRDVLRGQNFEQGFEENWGVVNPWEEWRLASCCCW